MYTVGRRSDKHSDNAIALEFDRSKLVPDLIGSRNREHAVYYP